MLVCRVCRALGSQVSRLSSAHASYELLVSLLALSSYACVVGRVGSFLVLKAERTKFSNSVWHSTSSCRVSTAKVASQVEVIEAGHEDPFLFLIRHGVREARCGVV